MSSPLPYLLTAAAMLSLGMYGMLARRSVVAILLSIELMVNAANLVFVTLARHHSAPSAQLFALFAMAVTVAEVVIGMAIVVVMYRARAGTHVENLAALKH